MQAVVESINLSILDFKNSQKTKMNLCLSVYKSIHIGF